VGQFPETRLSGPELCLQLVGILPAEGSDQSDGQESNKNIGGPYGVDSNGHAEMGEKMAAEESADCV
jgi:hypothetical protein